MLPRALSSRISRWYLSWPLLLSLAVAQSACLRPPSPAERLADNARQLNLAARFGRMDLAISRTSPAGRESFSQRRAGWGSSIRIVDVELSSIQVKDPEYALVQVDYSWNRISEGTLRTTRILQHWRSLAGGWALDREVRIGGDLGLFGETINAPEPKPARDVQFPTKIIREEPFEPNN